MTKDELLGELRRIRDEEEAGGDTESLHGQADDVLLDFIGDDEVKAAFDAIHKWYA